MRQPARKSVDKSASQIDSLRGAVFSSDITPYLSGDTVLRTKTDFTQTTERKRVLSRNEMLKTGSITQARFAWLLLQLGCVRSIVGTFMA
jgi:hypothetical protein